MAEVAPASVDPPAVKPKKKAAPKTARNRNSTPVKELIIKIVSDSKERKGISAAFLKKQLATKGYDVDKNKARIRLALKSLVANGTLNQTSGVGASGSFKLVKKTGEAKKKKSAVAAKGTPVKKSTSKAKVSKKQRTPAKKASPKKKSKKVATKPAAAKKATPVKNKKPVTPKKPKAKKTVPKKKPAAKKAVKSKGKKAAAKK